MSVTQVKQAVGSWSVRLRGNIPRSVLDRLEYFGHIAIVPGSVSVQEYGDNLLNVARYVGVFRSKAKDSDGAFTIGGGGMEMWLGDEDGIGDVFETAVTFTNATFATAIAGLLPPGGSIISGTINSVPGTYSGTHQYVTPRKALDYVTELFGAEWRVNNNGTLDAGTESQLYSTTPRALLVSKDDGSDLRYIALPGNASMDQDVQDFTTRVVLLGEGEGDTIAVGTANNAYNPYNDIHGNDVVVKRVVSESSTTGVNVDDRAAIILNQFAGERPRVTLSTRKYDLKGNVQVGDYIYVYNPAAGFEDLANEENWRGEIINPVKLRCIEMSWPIRTGWTVAFRDNSGVWTDLSSWTFYEGGDTSIVVGELPRSLVSGTGEPLNGRENPADTTIPAAPMFTDFSAGSYQSANSNDTKSAIQAAWTVPLNVDGSTIVDGGHYEIRYRASAVIGYRVKWGQLDGTYKWGRDLDGSRWGALLSEPVTASPEWQTAYIPWGTNNYTFVELTPGVTYEMQIRAVDAQIPNHLGPYSTSEYVTTVGDLFAPSVPAAPEVAGSRMGIQVTHRLGKNTGGEFNLEQDLDHLEVHVGGTATFYAGDDTMVGKMIATAGMLNAGIPSIATFTIEATEGVWVRVRAVDRSGNKSSASPASTVTVLLIDTAHISDLSVSKVTAGSILADWVLAASIKTGTSGSRAELSSSGLALYNSAGVQTVNLDTVTANIRVLEGRLEVVDNNGNTILEVGKTSEGLYGLKVNDNAGNPQVRAGQISSGYGLEAVDNDGTISSLSTLAFGMRATTVDTTPAISVWALQYATLPSDIPGDVGPSVTVRVGTSGRMLILASVLASVGGNFNDPLGGPAIPANKIAAITYYITGPVVRWANGGTGQAYSDSLIGVGFLDAPTDPQSGSTISILGSINLSFLESGLPPGTYTVTLKYMTDISGNNGPAGFRSRTLVALPY